MKKQILLSVFIVSIRLLTASAQPVQGVYYGALLSNKNVLVLTFKENILSGNLYLYPDEKLTITGKTEGLDLSGVIKSASAVWPFTGHLKNDTLYILLAEKKTTAKLKKISSNPNYNISKLLESTLRDESLVGEWLHLYDLDPVGNPKSVPAIAREAKHIFYNDGREKISSPAVERQLNSINIKERQPEFRWETRNNTLTTTGPETGMGKFYSARQYKVSGDTLIFIISDGSKSFYIKSRQIKSK